MKLLSADIFANISMLKKKNIFSLNFIHVRVLNPVKTASTVSWDSKKNSPHISLRSLYVQYLRSYEAFNLNDINKGKKNVLHCRF